MVRYRGGMEEFPYYSAKDILSGKVGDKELKGKIVFMGTSAAGLRDLRVTPFASDYPGVEVRPDQEWIPREGRMRIPSAPED